MLKLKTVAIITILLGIVSIIWVIYDYISLTDAVYKYGENLIERWRIVSYGFIPIILFHISFFLTMFYLFDFLKNQKIILKEYKQLKAEAELKKVQPENIQQKPETKPEKL